MSAGISRPGIWGRLEEATRDAPIADHEGANLWSVLAVIADPAEFHPRLRDDIEVKEFHLKWGNDYAMIRNPRNLVLYQLQPNEVTLLRLMDGMRSVKEIVLESFKESGELEMAGVIELVKALHMSAFLEQDYQDLETPLKHALHPVSSRREAARKFATTLRVDWKNADAPVRWLYHHGLKYLLTVPAQWVAGLFAAVGLAAFIAVVHWGRFSFAGHGSLTLGFLVLITLNYLGIVVHELGHALVLIHYGRRVRSAGFFIYFGSPALFVEAGDGLMLERGQRILQAFAGGYSMMLVASVTSILAWAYPGLSVAETLYRFSVLVYLTVFMNFIPLLELDGYWILTDLIQVPDLRPRSLAFVRHELWRRVRRRTKLTKQELGLALYGTFGVAFTIFSFYTSFFFWRLIFGGLVSKLWNGGLVTRILLAALAIFVTGPVVRGMIRLLRTLFRRSRALVRDMGFRLERRWRVEAATLIDGLPLFEDVPEDILSDLAGRVRLRSVAAGEPVVRQGERATAFYVVRTGTFQVVEEDHESGNERPLRLLTRGEGFGELGLSEGSPRTATVRSLEEGEVFEIDKATFDRLLADMSQVPQFAPTIQWISELRDLKAFSHLEADELGELVRHGQWLNFAAEDVIIEQGEVGDSFYAIRSGQLRVFEGGKQVRTMGPGMYFGEIALLLDVPRTATVQAITPVRVFRLDRQGFERVIATSFKKGTLDPTISSARVWEH
jgi:CRP-like cAMP-binding protein